MKKNLLFICLCFFTCQLFGAIPQWMDTQIKSDFNFFKDKKISLSELNEFYEKKAVQHHLIKYEIIDNRVWVNAQHTNAKKNQERIKRFYDILTLLCQTKGLPNTTLLISISDGLNAKEEMPIFAMCKMDSDRIILIPDYEALGERYQVLKSEGIDITKEHFPWESKVPQLIWRGSTAQLYLKMTNENLNRFSRVKLCELSQSFPEMIDAKFTLFVQDGDKIASLKQFEGNHISFLDQMNYKYHLLIDGNVCPYTKSGWKLFAGSLLFKPESPWQQWYFNALKPYVHYLPIKANLSDLVDQIHWALDNDFEAKQMAENCRQFAVEEFTLSNHLLYLYEVILRYQALNFIP